ncbi:hypothetical protein TNCV_123311 [Trichonephila clavipes]|nr:hypothetical protein TNCV_123311 [Trichonephila clavipes]
MDDNACSRKAPCSNTSNQKIGGITHLNHIEHVWFVLIHSFATRKPSPMTIDELKSALGQEMAPFSVIFNNCSLLSDMSPSEVDVVFRKIRGGKTPDIDLIDYAIWKAL